MKTVLRYKLVILLAAVLAAPFLTVTYASFSGSHAAKGTARAARVASKDAVPAARVEAAEPRATSFEPPLAALQLPPESISVSLGACGGAAATTVNLGQTICARLSNAPLGIRLTQIRRRIVIVHPSGYIAAQINVTSNPQDLSFTLPATQTSTIGNDVVDNRGTWRVLSTAPGSGAPATEADFDVAGVADLALYSSAVDAGALSPGDSVSFRVYLVNYGPDDADNVVLTAHTPTNASFTSADQDNVQNSGCVNTGGDTVCTIGTLARGAKTAFTFTYQVSGAATVGSSVVLTADVATSTAQRTTRDNSTKAAASISEAASTTPCVIQCPADVIVTVPANSTGTALTLPAASIQSGDCGTITNNPPGNNTSFVFPVGTTTVTSTASGTQTSAGDSCTFLVKVLNTPAPTISCPTDKTATDTDSNGSENVVVGTPAYSTAAGSGTGGVVTGVRSDNVPAVNDENGNVITPAVVHALTDPYPVGLTSILWTVTDADGRMASCTQKVTVFDNTCAGDTTPPTIKAPAAVSVGTGANNTSCGVALDDELGQPDVGGNCTVTYTVSGIPPGNLFAPGIYTLTYTARDAAGNTATDTQTVTVVDDTPPIIKAPADASYTCLGDVPAANASQAKGPVLDANGQFVRDTNGQLVFSGGPFDNCGLQSVTVSETATGVGSAASPRVITRTFTARDAAGNQSSDVQTITVTDPTPPSVALVGSSTMTVECHTSFTDPGATASDNCGTANVTVSGSVDADTPGTYTLTYTATDAAGNTSEPATRTVTVVDTTKPIVSLNGNADVTVECHTSFTDTGATASDSCAGSLAVSTSGSVDVNTVGDYTLTYSATDPSGNTGTATRVIHVRDTIAPTVTLNGASVVEVFLHGTYTELGATASDSCAGSLPVSITGSVNTNAIGSYVLTYSATDPSGNTGTATRTVNVIYKFTGFFSPIANQPTINQVNAGRSVPIKFSLDGNQGLNIFAANSPFTTQVNCATNTPIDVQDTGTAGSSSLTYDGTQYVYVWKTDSSWVGQCRILSVALNDGKTYTAYFKFK